MIIGGIAVIARGVRRMTTDVDAVVSGEAVQVRTLIETCLRHDIEPRIDDCEVLAANNLVLLLRHEPTGVDLDVSLGWTSFEQEALDACDPVRLVVSRPRWPAEDLVVFKAMASRPKDIEDASSLLLMHPDIDLRRVRRVLRELATLAEEPGLERSLDAIIDSTRSESAPDTRSRRPPSVAKPSGAGAKKASSAKKGRAQRSGESCGRPVRGRG